MRKSIEWFANPLPRHHRFMAAFKITANRLKLREAKLLYSLIHQPDEDGIDRSYRYFRWDAVRDNQIGDIRAYFLEVYNDEQACIDYLNRMITEKYFARTSFTKAKNLNTKKVNSEIKHLMDNVFEHLEL